MMAPRTNKPNNAQTIDKLAWVWAETTEPETVTDDHVRQAYRLTLKPCGHTANRRNCRGNPRCLFGIGERGWFVDILDTYWYTGPAPDDARRKKGDRCGLRNFGATCYVNTLLQVWYNNPELRDAVYRYRDPDLQGVDLSQTGYCPQSVCGQLQLIFALMERSLRKHVDPLSLINTLGLDTMQQQDAQEFSKLFMSLLGNTLSRQPDEIVRNVVQEEFGGLYKYLTTCNTCGFVSERNAEFYELDLNVKGNRDLQACLREFLKEEKLEGENQYACQQCNQKRDASRRISLTRLPRTLNCQLLRFVYDRSSQQKKKINTSIQFPEELDMSPYVRGTPSGEAVYQLCAVLIHRGNTPYSGHYIAHIRHRGQGKAESEADVWYKYNDEQVEKMKGTSLHLGAEEELIDTPKQNGPESGEPSPKKARLNRGIHTSQNAYMLVYRSQTSAHLPLQDGGCPLPDHVIRAVQRDNDEFEVWCEEQKNKKEEAIRLGRAKQLSIQQTYDRLLPLRPPAVVDGTSSNPVPAGDGTKVPFQLARDEVNELSDASVTNGESLSNAEVDRNKCDGLAAKFGTECGPLVAIPETRTEFMSSEWLTSYFTDPDACKEIDNKTFLCKHGRLDVDQVGQMKLVNSEVAAEFYAKYGGGPVIPSDSLCRECVTSRCRTIRLKWRISADQQLVNQLLKQPVPSGEVGYWVGKQSIRNWKTVALRSLDDRTDSVYSATSNEDAAESDDVVDHVTFNADVLCDDHDELTVDENKRRVVPGALWTLYRSYFPDAPEVSTERPMCTECQLQAAVDADERDRQRHLAAECRRLLPDLYANKKRPRYDVLITPDVVKVDDVATAPETTVSATSSMDESKAPCDVTSTNGPTSPLPVTSASALTSSSCPSLQEEVVTYYAVSRDYLEEWRKFVRSQGRYSLAAPPGVGMFLCTHARLARSLVSFLNTFSDDTPRAALLYESEWSKLSLLFPSMTSQSICLRLRHSGYNKFYSVIPDVCSECQMEQKVSKTDTFTNATIYIHRLPNGNSENNGQVQADQSQPSLQPPTNPKAELDQPIRRSHRYRRSRDDLEIRVDSSNTVREVKIKLMGKIHIAPFDQHLYLCGQELADETWTLADCGLSPNSVLHLKVDEPDEKNNVYWPQDAQSLSACPEEGFKGTGLLGGQ